MFDKEGGAVRGALVSSKPFGGEVPVTGVAEAELEVLDKFEEVGTGGIDGVLGGEVLEVLSDVSTDV